MRKTFYLAFLVLAMLLGFAWYAEAQIVPNQNQQTTGPFGGIVLSTTTSPTAKLGQILGSAYGDLLYWTGSRWNLISTSSLGITGSGTPGGTAGQVQYKTSAGTFGGAATGTVSNGTGISVTAGQSIIGSGLTITNTAPDQTVSITGSGGTSVTGTYPNFTVSSFAYPFSSNATSTIITFNGGLTAANSVTFSGITGSTQCLHVNSSGVLSGTGSDCGTGSGGVTLLTATYPIIVSAATGAVNITTAFSTTTNWGIGNNGFVVTSNGGVPFTAASSTLNLPNSALQNSSITINGTPIVLGASGTVTAASSTLLTDSNKFGSTQTFTNSPVFSTLGAGTVNSSAAGTIYNTATTSVTNSTGIGFTGTAGALIGGSNLTITNTGVITNSCPGGFLSCSGTNPSAFTLGTLGVANGGTGSTTLGGLLTGNGTSVYSSPTTTATCSGSASCSAFTVIGSTPVVISASGGGSSFPFTPFPNYNATSTTLGLLNGFFSTASSTIGGAFNLPSLSAGTVNVAPTTGLTYTTATTSVTAGTAITFGGTAGALIGGTNLTINCATANTTTQGCLTSTDWNTFNNKIGWGQATSTSPNQIVYTNNNGLLVSAASSSLSLPNSALQNSSITVNGTPISLGASGTVTAASSTLLADFNKWANIQNFSNATTPQISLTQGTGIGITMRAEADRLNFSTTTANAIATSSDSSIFNLFQTGKASLGIGAGTANGTLSLYDQNGTGPSIVLGGNVGGDTDYWQARSSNNDGVDNDPLQWGFGLTPGVSPFMTLDNRGRVGIGTTSPTAWLTVATTSSLAFVVADAFNTIRALFNTASTTGSIFTVAATTTTNAQVLAGTGIKLFDVDQYGHQTASSTGASPALSSCGTSPILGTNSNDVTGTITMGSGTPSACTVTFATPYTQAPTVVTTLKTPTITHYISAISATAFTVTLSGSTAGASFTYIVMQP